MNAHSSFQLSHTKLSLFSTFLLPMVQLYKKDRPSSHTSEYFGIVGKMSLSSVVPEVRLDGSNLLLADSPSQGLWLLFGHPKKIGEIL